MKLSIGILALAAIFTSCADTPRPNPLIGTWELIAATSIKKDTTVSTFNPQVRMIKIITPTHFAFLSHDTGMAKDSSSAAFTAGGGAYTLTDSVYTEHLEYFIDKAWENHIFQFVVKITNDTLVQKGVEKIDSLGIDHVIIEKYKRVKN